MHFGLVYSSLLLCLGLGFVDRLFCLPSTPTSSTTQLSSPSSPSSPSSTFLTLPMYRSTQTTGFKSRYIGPSHLLPDSMGDLQTHFYTNITVGGTNFKLIVDTGSTDTAVPLVSCVHASYSSAECGVTDSGGSPCSSVGLDITPSVSSISCSTGLGCLNSITANEYCASTPSDAQSQCLKEFQRVFDPSSWCGPCNGEKIQGFTNGCCVGAAYGVSCIVGWRGMVIQESVSIGDLSGSAQLAGMVQLVGSPFAADSGPQGVMGLAFATLSAYGKKPIAAQLLEQNGFKQQFAICFGPTGGSMYLGGYDSSVVNGSMLHVPLSSQDSSMLKSAVYSYYTLPIASLTLGTNAPSSVQYPVIVDSGTPGLIMAYDMWATVTGLFNSTYCKDSEVLVSVNTTMQFVCLPKGDPMDVPSLNLVTADGVKIPVFEYVKVQQVGAETVWILLFTSTNNMQQTILGTTFMAPYVTVFDMDNKQVLLGTKIRGSCNGGERTGVYLPSSYPLDSNSVPFFETLDGYVVIGVIAGVGGGIIFGAIFYLVTGYWDRKKRRPRHLVEMTAAGQ